MAEIDQFDLFLPLPTENDFLRADLNDIKESLNKIRKAQFAKIGEIKKMQMEIIDRMEILEHNICRGK